MGDLVEKFPFKYAVISAAGTGSRLGENCPKILVEVQGRTIAEYLLDLLRYVETVIVVVGYQKEEVKKHILSIRGDVEFVDNDQYSTTSNSYSLYLATKDLSDPFVMIDGDMLINRASFAGFVSKIREGQSLIGIARSKTEDAVFVSLDSSESRVIDFHRSPVERYEWCGVAYLAGIPIWENEGYIYKNFENFLPLASGELECHEVDTPADLALARREFVF